LGGLTKRGASWIWITGRALTNCQIRKARCVADSIQGRERSHLTSVKNFTLEATPNSYIKSDIAQTRSQTSASETENRSLSLDAPATNYVWFLSHPFSHIPSRVSRWSS
jgi:hypothetical protein